MRINKTFKKKGNLFLLFLLGGVIIDTNNNEDKKWTVYIHISPSNKKYVGITSLNPPKKDGLMAKGIQKINIL